MSNISLTASMRSNLLSLQNTSKLMNQTQERLSTGKKVNSAIDNPSSFYTAQSFNIRASDLSGLLDSMGQAISTIKAANEGIEAITSFVEQAQAVATSALGETDGTSRKAYMDQFNAIRTQIDELASDSGYKGVNLLGGTSVNLTVNFNEDRSNKLTIAGVDASTTGLSINKAAWGGAAITGAAVIGAEPPAADIAKGAYFSVDGVVYRALSKIDKADATTAKIDVSAHEKMVKIDNSYYDFTSDAAATAIQASITEAIKAIDTLRNDASTFGNNYSIVQTREDFTTNLINVLEEGADKLTLADMNEESANMLALQTRQQLAINSLSLASQAAQSVLKLF
jgi:flagellin-like hook-associated protein FlgL